MRIDTGTSTDGDHKAADPVQPQEWSRQPAAPTSSSAAALPPQTAPSLRALRWLNFFVADVQTGLGPFLAAYLAASGWRPARLGIFLTISGLIPVVLQIGAGALVDRIRRFRLWTGVFITLVGIGAALLSWRSTLPVVASADALLVVAGLFVGLLLNAMLLGITGPGAFDRQLGRNQAFAAAGNVASALLLAAVAYRFGNRYIFLCSAFLVFPTLVALSRIRSSAINPLAARNALPGGPIDEPKAGVLQVILEDRVLLVFLPCAALFHLANAAMLPQLGEMLAHGSARSAAPLMSACIIVTQLVITLGAARVGREAASRGRRPLLLLGFAALTLRGVLYTLVHGHTALIAVQLLDGVANVIFGVVSALIIADRTRGTGRYNLAQGALGTSVGIGAALSTTVGGLLIQHLGYNASFLGLAAIGALALLLLWFTFPETLRPASNVPATSA
jgi:predicted MFS family arabinose efflux permease